MQKTDFGFQQIPIEEKVKKVGEVFHTVANRYDLMNDLMSFGLHRVWKKITTTLSDVKQGDRVLDVASGTGDLAKAFAKRVGEKGVVYLTDINDSMLSVGRDKLTDVGIINNVHYVQADAEHLPFPDNYFDCISIAFGLRNVTRKEAALRSMLRVLKPGGVLLVLEFSKPAVKFLQPIYDAYSFKLLPKIGEWVTGSKDSYQYLVESIRQHPDQETLKRMILDSGFAQCSYHNFTGGVVALHRAHKA